MTNIPLPSINNDEFFKDGSNLIIGGSFRNYLVNSYTKTINLGLDGDIYESEIDVLNATNKETGISKKFIGITHIHFKDLSSLAVNSETPPIASNIIIDTDSSTSVNIPISKIINEIMNLDGGQLKITRLLDFKGGNAKFSNQGDINFKFDKDYEGISSFLYHVKNIDTGIKNIDNNKVYLRTPELPKDTDFFEQWHLPFCNILLVWKKYTGSNIKIAILDTGMIPDHPDLDIQNDNKYMPKYLNNNPIVLEFNLHALNVASVIGAKRNDIFLVGVAYNSLLYNFQLPMGKMHRGQYEFIKDFDIINNSWGHNGLISRASNKLISAIKEGAQHGREGLGTNIIFASGNGGLEGHITTLDPVTNSPFSIAVGGINKPDEALYMQSKKEYIATPGSSILISAPATNLALLHTNDFSFHNAANYNPGIIKEVQGTSFSAPIISGIIALMLEANPELGYRDVQEILAYSATKYSDSYKYNKANNFNGGGLHYSYNYGFGLVNADKAVRLAENWPVQQTYKNMDISSIAFPKTANLIEVNKPILYKIKGLS